MSTRETQAADIAAPSEGKVYRRATAASSTRYEIPSEWKGNFVTFQAEGLEIQVLFGDSAVSITDSQVSSLSGETLTANDASGVKIPSGQTRDYRIKATHTHFAVLSSGTTGYWAAWLSDNLGVR